MASPVIDPQDGINLGDVSTRTNSYSQAVGNPRPQSSNRSPQSPRIRMSPTTWSSNAPAKNKLAEPVVDEGNGKVSSVETQDGEQFAPIPGPWNRNLFNPIQMARMVTFSYVTPLFVTAWGRQLNPSDMYGLMPRYSSEVRGLALERAYIKNRERKLKHPLAWALVTVHSFSILVTGMFLAFEFASALAQAVLLGMLLNEMRDESVTDRKVYSTAGWLSGVTVARQCVTHVGHYYMHTTGMELRTAAVAAIFRKVLRVRSETLSGIQVGHLISVMTADCERLIQSWGVHSMWLAPILMAAVLTLGWFEIGPAIFAGAGFMFLLFPLQVFFGKLFAILRRKTSKCTDARVSTMKDIIDGIRSVRAAGWEKPFSELIESLRKAEITNVFHVVYIKSFNSSTFFGAVSISSMISMLTYNAAGGNPTPAKVFTVFSLLSVLRVPVGIMLPRWIQIANEMRNTVNRMEAILDLEETHASGILSTDGPRRRSTVPGSTEALDISDLQFMWRTSKDPTKVHPQPEDGNEPKENGTAKEIATNGSPLEPETPILDGVNLKIRFGELAVVRGPVGSGKSTLLSLILGETLHQGGVITILDGCPMFYAPQVPWIFPESIRNNIIFGNRYDEKVFKTNILLVSSHLASFPALSSNTDCHTHLTAHLQIYRKTIEACQLISDLLLFQDGDRAMVGERGITLSGGQKARVSLARAVYGASVCGRRAIVLLDDPLSAVDARVGEKLYSRVIRGVLRQHAVLLVTHHLRFGKDADRVLNLGSDLTHLGDSDTDDKSDHEGVSRDDSLTSQPSSPTGKDAHKWEGDQKAKSVIQEEHRKAGSLSRNTYATYILSSGPVLVIIFTFIMFVATQAIGVYMELSLGRWAEDVDNAEEFNDAAKATNSTARENVPDETVTLSILLVAFLGLLFSRSLLYMHLTVKSSRRIHDKAFVGLINTPLRFFDTQPVGRILNRFSKDVDYIDDLMPDTGMDTLQLALQCLAVFAVICFIDPYIILFVTPCLVIFYMLRKIYLKASREVKRIEGVKRSPLYAHLNMAVDGLEIVRTYPGAAERILTQFSELHDHHTQTWLTYTVTGRWLGFRLDLIMSFLAVATAFSSVAQRDKIGTGGAGLSLAYSTQLAGIVQWALRQSAEFENQITAVERLNEYARLPSEQSFVGCGGAGKCSACNGVERNAGDKPWTPTEAAIEMRDVRLWYSDPETPVLHGINISIQPGSKVGVVGRTGAGKSSLIAALLRLAPTSGSVKIDGTPTCSIPLQDLRRAFTLIPQDPALFAGTIRKNLDPFSTCSDSDLWVAIESAQLKPVIEAAGGLEATVTEAGGNFSVGERQLICLARAVLRPTKLLLLDEATANVDMATDAIIQRVIRDRFAECTVITIAHRLNTVLDSDFILVMDKGVVAEYGRPDALIRDRGSHLAAFGISAPPSSEIVPSSPPNAHSHAE